MRTHIREKLRAAFSVSGFAVEFAGPVSAGEVVASNAEVRYVLRHAGRTVKRVEVASSIVGQAAGLPKLRQASGLPPKRRRRASPKRLWKCL